MKTLLVTIEFPPFIGGVANYYSNLVKYWPAKDDIYVLDNSSRKLNAQNSWPEWLPSIFNIREEIKKNNIDHIIVGQILPLGIAVWFLKMFYHFDYTIMLHGMDLAFSQKTFRKKVIAKKIIAGAKQIICSNSYTAEEVKNFLDDKAKVHTVNPGIDVTTVQTDVHRIDQLKEQFGLQDKTIIFSLGRLVKRKGFDSVIKTLKNEKFPNIEYFIAGNGPDETYLRNLACDAPFIHFLGEINNDGKWAWLGLCDIFIMPARNIAGDYEGFGIVYLEANLASKPVIAGDSGGVKDAVIDGLNGLLVKPENEKDLATAIRKLSENNELREKMGAQGRVRASELFTWEKLIQKIYLIINDK